MYNDHYNYKELIKLNIFPVLCEETKHQIYISKFFLHNLHLTSKQKQFILQPTPTEW